MYRALEHTKCKHPCRNSDLISKFPTEIKNFANQFVQMQERRHQCDYDPLVDAAAETVAFDIEGSLSVIEAFRLAPEIDKRAFCALVLFDTREDPIRKKIEKERRDNERRLEIESQKRKQKERLPASENKAGEAPQLPQGSGPKLRP